MADNGNCDISAWKLNQSKSIIILILTVLRRSV